MELHFPTKCNFCLKLKLRARKNWELKLYCFMMEGLCQPASDPRQRPLLYNGLRTGRLDAALPMRIKRKSLESSQKDPRKQSSSPMVENLSQGQYPIQTLVSAPTDIQFSTHESAGSSSTMTISKGLRVLALEDQYYQVRAIERRPALLHLCQLSLLGSQYPALRFCKRPN